MTKGKIATAVLLVGLIADAFGQAKVEPKPLPETPVVAGVGPTNVVDVRAPATWTGFIGLGHGKNKGFQPVGSVNYRLTDHYGLYVARSTVSYSGGVSFSFGHSK